MRKSAILFLVIGSIPGLVFAQGGKPVHPPLLTRWTKDVSAENVHPEYPRPTMVRTNWLNLNGEWDYGITHLDQTNAGTYTGKILVPFPVESKLSGVKCLFTENQRLWYRRKFNVPASWKGQRVLLHFDAVDWEAKVWVNGKELGVHRGGYDRFSFDITDAIKQDVEQELSVSVFDPTDAGEEAHGKQMLNPRDPFLHASSGIWQTVWLEPVTANHVESMKLVPDIDAGSVTVAVTGNGDTNLTTVEAIAFDGTNEVGRVTGGIGEKLLISIPHAKLWSPSNPFLYDLKVCLSHDGHKLDEVLSYFGMRKISVGKDGDRYPRLLLNNQRIFQLGVLDQGYWPDGIYTAPSDEALRSDIELAKSLGFNLCRKHVKVEPERWYYWCDKLGLLVWQDMPSGGRATTARDQQIKWHPQSSEQFETELQQMVVGLGNHPSIVMWVSFNQGWGQYDTARITDLIKKLDPSRLVLGASGWFDFGVGDVRSLHQYPGPPRPEHDGKRACVIGECGSLGWAVPDHFLGPTSRWNTTLYSSSDELAAGYDSLAANIQALEKNQGLSAAVITELTDAESVVDGFITFDRAVVKIPVGRVKAANQKVLLPPVKKTQN